MADEAAKAEKEAEEKLRAKFGSLPNKKDALARRMAGDKPDRKYFDSADYSMDQQLASMSSEPKATTPPGGNSSSAADVEENAERPPPIRQPSVS